MLEKMADFFEKRLDDYDAHMINDIQSADEFYSFTAHCLPDHQKSTILDLGCGTGLELEYYIKIAHEPNITGIDLSEKMLGALKAKFPKTRLELIQGSYFDIPFGEEIYDAAVSVESLHHFTAQEKTPLYKKLCRALKKRGYFILTDYFAENDAAELTHRRELERLKLENGINDNDFYHYDTPLTVAHETQCLLNGGFSRVEVLCFWGATYTLGAYK